MNNKGTLYIIAAPSGAGKTSLVNALLNEIDDIQISISYTTRPARPRDRNDIDYHFIDEQCFNQMVADDALLEHAFVFGYYYGTGKEWVLSRLSQGIDVILEIDWQGARQIRTLFPPAISIFILPPSLQLLKERLIKRNQDGASVISERMKDAYNEMLHFKEFDFLIINDKFECALADLICVIRAQRLRKLCQEHKYERLLAELLQNK